MPLRGRVTRCYIAVKLITLLAGNAETQGVCLFATSGLGFISLVVWFLIRRPTEKICRLTGDRYYIDVTNNEYGFDYLTR